MPLPKGLTPRLVELGKIKIGTLGEERKSRSGGTYRLPTKLDCFLIQGHARDANGRLITDQAVMDALKADGFGVEETIRLKSGEERVVEKVRELPIYVLSDDPDDIMLSQYVHYEGRQRLATCDGVTCTTYYNGPNKLDAPTSAPCDGEHTRKGWKVHTKFHCVVASSASRFGGVYILRTTSVITTEQLYGGLLHTLALTCGVLRGVPLRLVIRPMLVAPEGKPTTVYVVHVELHAKDLNDVQAKALQAAQYRTQHHRQIQEAQRQYVAMLKAPGEDEPDEEVADVSDEFHPPAVKDRAPEDRPADPWDSFTATKRTVEQLPGEEDEPLEDPEREPGADEDEPPPAGHFALDGEE